MYVVKTSLHRKLHNKTKKNSRQKIANHGSLHINAEIQTLSNMPWSNKIGFNCLLSSLITGKQGF